MSTILGVAAPLPPGFDPDLWPLDPPPPPAPSDIYREMVSAALQQLHDAQARERIQAGRIAALTDEVRDLRRQLGRARAV